MSILCITVSGITLSSEKWGGPTSSLKALKALKIETPNESRGSGMGRATPPPQPTRGFRGAS